MLILCLYRWLHAACDGMEKEEEVERILDKGYVCLMCRPHTKLPEPVLAIENIQPLVPVTKSTEIRKSILSFFVFSLFGCVCIFGVSLF